MEFLVCISKSPDTTTKISFTEGGESFDESGVQFIINPYDEWYALVRAIELVEKSGGSVTTVTVGEADCDSIIRKALAIGAHKAIRVNTVPMDAMQVAAELAAVAKSGAYDAVLCGKETINHNGGIVPGMLAEMLDLPLVTWATSLDYEDGKAVMQRDTVNGIEKVSVDGPYVLSASKGMSEQRIPNMRGIMGARSKPLDVVESCGAQATTSVASFALPPAKSGVKLVDADNPAELIRLLREEAKAI